MPYCIDRLSHMRIALNFNKSRSHGTFSSNILQKSRSTTSPLPKAVLISCTVSKKIEKSGLSWTYYRMLMQAEVGTRMGFNC